MPGATYTVIHNHDGGGGVSVVEGCAWAIGTLVAVALMAAFIWWILDKFFND